MATTSSPPPTYDELEALVHEIREAVDRDDSTDEVAPLSAGEAARILETLG